MMLAADQSFGPFRLAALIGKGGMGEVYLATDTRLGRRTALKILPAALAADGPRMRRFIGEAKAASALNHPNILTIYEIGEIEGTHFIASEYIEGETLRERLDRGPVDPETAIALVLQIAGAAAAAHQAGIIHRDLKPENIMVRRDGLVKLLDFGIAKLSEPPAPETTEPPGDDTGNHTQTLATDGMKRSEAATLLRQQTEPGLVIGTAAYMSPEQARGKPVDARSDIFSLGVVLYEMLAGRLPFDGENAIETIGSVLHQEPPLLGSEIPAGLRHIVQQCLQKNRDERVQSCAELLAALNDLRRELQSGGTPEHSALPYRNAAATLPDDNARPVAASGRKVGALWAGGLLVLLLAAGGLALWFSGYGFSDARSIESIAVMPFVNASGNPELDYLSDGLTEELIGHLTQLPSLNVKASSSVFRFKGKDASVRTIGRELEVSALLNGRVLQRGNDVTLSVELVDVATENVLWKANYTRVAANLSSLQNEIALDVSRRLEIKLSGDDRQHLTRSQTNSQEAYQHYLKGRFYLNKRTHKDIEKAIEHFQSAVAIDRNYALAYTGLAHAYTVLPGYTGSPPPDSLTRAREAAVSALSLDGRLPEAHVSLGVIMHSRDYNFQGAEREFRRALELDPNNVLAHQYYGVLLAHLGRHDEAEAEMRKALELDPLSLNLNRVYGLTLLQARRYDEAARHLQQTLELDPGFMLGYFSLANVYRMQNRRVESVETYCRGLEVGGSAEAARVLRTSFANGGWEAYLRARLTHRDGNSYIQYFNASIYAELGETDQAFAALNKSYENRESFLTMLKVDPLFDPLRDDPRFREMLTKIGFPP